MELSMPFYVGQGTLITGAVVFSLSLAFFVIRFRNLWFAYYWPQKPHASEYFMNIVFPALLISLVSMFVWFVIEIVIRSI